MTTKRDHGGGLNTAIDQYGGQRTGWLDLSTDINPNPYPVPEIPAHYWHVSPDETPKQRLLDAAQKNWNVLKGAEIVPASGVSAIIAQLPNLIATSQVSILNPTYNEFGASFIEKNWTLQKSPSSGTCTSEQPGRAGILKPGYKRQSQSANDH